MSPNDLSHFRALAAAMAGPAPQDWQWIGRYESQRMFGLTEQRARHYAQVYGGRAQRMEPPQGSFCGHCGNWTPRPQNPHGFCPDCEADRRHAEAEGADCHG